MFRIYRDVRFSRDKRPYKEHGACQFRHRLGRDARARASTFICTGGDLLRRRTVDAESDALAKVRDAIVRKAPLWKRQRAVTILRAGSERSKGRACAPPRGLIPTIL